MNGGMNDGMNDWIIIETDANLQLMSQVLDISETTAKVMANRGIRSKNAALLYLKPIISRLRDAYKMKDMAKAIEIVSAAITDGKKIVIYGDYDVDGIMSTVILYKTLKAAGANCEYYIPHRVEEGYGLNLESVEKIAADGAGLIIAVDNGISAVEEISAATAAGVEVVVIDHHEPNEVLPPAAAIINPKQADCNYPFKEMCAAGLVYMFAKTMMKTPFFQQAESGRLLPEFLTLAAIATLCDIVDLVDENRILVAAGLAALNANKLINPGIGSLITVREYLQKPIDAFAVGYIIGPCLNATGRLDSAAQAVELLTATPNETEKRLKLAVDLVSLNNTRKDLTNECLTRALQITNDGVKGASLLQTLPKIVVITDDQAHESVAGIVAGRIRDITCRPTILLTKGETAKGDKVMKGSARSIEGYNIFEELSKQQHLFHRFGGHAMAAGLTLNEENIEPLRKALNDECTLRDDDFRQKFYCDGELAPEEITLELSEELTKLAPFGRANREPLFVSYGLFAQTVRVLNEKNTLVFTFVCNTGKSLKGIVFGLNEKYIDACNAAGVNKTGGITLDVLFHIETNVWKNVAEVQVRLKDFRVKPNPGGN
ncbi:MAG: single-stranded-DNA-specific exonuclease RecJ [Defluviitaleaceae bacterium]|nr:single-stranded-DNA-specific exonuclease RecJ [Defluviitaleaceae bacterium]